MTRTAPAATAVPGTAVPRNRSAWLREIARAWADACETLPFMPPGGRAPKHAQLFHLAPLIAVKMRGVAKSKSDKALEAALCSYVASTEAAPGLLTDPRLAFAFCYLASHFGLGLVSSAAVGRLMRFIENHPDQLDSAIGGAAGNSASGIASSIGQKPKRLAPRTRMTLSLTQEQMALIAGLVLMDDSLEKMFRKAKVTDGIAAIRGTLGDFAELECSVAVTTNHTSDRKLRKQLDAISGEISALLWQ